MTSLLFLFSAKASETEARGGSTGGRGEGGGEWPSRLGLGWGNKSGDTGAQAEVKLWPGAQDDDDTFVFLEGGDEVFLSSCK